MEREEKKKRKKKIKAKHLLVLSWYKIMLWAVQMYFNDTMRVVTVADIIGVHRSTVYNWINRYEDRGKDGLRYKFRKAHTTYKIPEETVEEIVQLYNKGYGCLRISYELKIGHTTA